MLKVGLTGNIGSGKTFIATVFSKLGIPIFHADTEARKLFDHTKIKLKIKEVFGSSVFSPDGEVLRPVLAEMAFADPELLDKLNKIIHPAVRNEYQQWCLQHSEATYTLYEAAILFESGYYKDLDKIICVTAPVVLRVRRVMERDKITRQEVERRMAYQWDEEKKVKLADYIIKNDESDMVIKQVMEVHKNIVQSAKFKGQR